MSETAKSHKKEYFIIFALLAILTAVEIWVPESSMAKKLKFWSLMSLAAIKAWLVAYFFMHLKEEKRMLKYIAAAPLVAVGYTLVVAFETIYR